MSTVPVTEPRCLDVPADRVVDLVIEARLRDLGTVTVARLLPSPKRRMVGPFIFIDHMGPIEIPPGVGFDVRPHPHIGLSTVTYFLAGENVHRDSLGNVRVNRPGDVNLMTAGGGIVHSERAEPAFRAAGGTLHGLQIWLALPDANEDDAPSFEHHPEATLPAIAPAHGVTGRVLLGEAFGARSPIRHPSQPMLVDLRIASEASCELPADVPERGLLVIEGALRIDRSGSAGLRSTAEGRCGDSIDGDTLGPNQLAVLCHTPTRVTATAPTRAVLFGGPNHPPRFIEWNFVASSRERIERARDRWKAREFPTIPGDDKEFTPWPGDHP